MPVGGATFDHGRRFGVEIEAYGLTMDRVTEVVASATARGCQVVGYGDAHRTIPAWKVTSDGSVRGEHTFELVSPPLAGAGGLADLKAVLNAISRAGARVNRSCGLHVHHDAADLDVTHLKALATLWWRFEDVLLYFVSPSRRANSYARPAVDRGFGSAFGLPRTASVADEVSAFAAKMSTRHQRKDTFANAVQPDRYSMLNFQALARHGTVEFRAHQGTVNYAKVEAWIALTQTLVTRARHARVTIAPRLVGEYAAETRFFFRAIHWVNLTDPVIIRAKNHLRERFNAFRREGSTAHDEAEVGEGPRTSAQLREAEAARAAVRSTL